MKLGFGVPMAGDWATPQNQLRVARAATGRDKIIKMEGSYHGHHDSVLFSVVPEADVLGLRHGVEHDKAWYTTEPTSKGIPRALWETVIVVPFNDAEAVQEAFRDNPGQIAAVILEPVMMNIGLVVPKPGYLQALRDACEQHGAALVYDEVKCGGTIAYGGTTERFGVRPHLAAYAKAVGGGATIGAFGGEARFMEWVTKGAAQQGTFNGNPLSAAAGLAALTQVLTKDAYDHLGKLGTLLAEGCQRSMDDHDIPGHTMDLGAKGCVSYRKEPLTNYRDFLETEPDFFYASFSWMITRTRWRCTAWRSKSAGSRWSRRSAPAKASASSGSSPSPPLSSTSTCRASTGSASCGRWPPTPTPARFLASCSPQMRAPRPSSRYARPSILPGM